MPNKIGKDLNKLFNPDSIAILGASRDEKKIGHIVLKNIVNSGFRGRIFPINPNTASVEGMDCYANYKDLPEIPDLAILSIPAEAAVALLEPIAKKGTKNIIVFSSGFREIGPQGAKLENSLRIVAEKYKLNILGPNCLGFVNVSANINATFSQAGSAKGNLRFISQSGALASGIFDWALAHNLGFSEFITLGNKSVLNENDILRYWQDELKKSIVPTGLSNYQPIGMYLESIDAGKEFLNLVSKISLTNPVFILKAGKSKKAQEAARSHTGSMAGDAAVQEAAFKDACVIRCEATEDMFDLARAFSWENAPKGPRVAIVSNAGGPAVISVDMLEKEGLQLASLSKKTIKRLQEKLPAAANVFNPVDVLGDALADRYAEAIDSVLSEKNVDALLIILTPQVMTEIEATADVIGKLSAKYRKPIVCSFMGGNLVDKGEEVLDHYKIPSFRFPERAVRTLARMWEWQLSRRRVGIPLAAGKGKNSAKVKLLTKNTVNKISKITKLAKNQNRDVLSIFEADKILNLCGIKTPKSAVIKNLNEAEKFAKAQGWPVVLKISSPAMIHKTDGGGVIVNIDNPVKLAAAWKKISQAAAKLPKKSGFSLHIQKQIHPGIEMILGVKYDESFGNVLMAGAGGVLAELLVDINLKLLPLDERGAKNLLAKSKVYPLLNGFRGQKAVALNKLITLMIKVGRLAQAAPWLKEITINPVIINATDAVAVDTRIILRTR
mgnify:CR=1 FL=1